MVLWLSLLILFLFRHYFGAPFIEKLMNRHELKIHSQPPAQEQVAWEKKWTRKSQYVDLYILALVVALYQLDLTLIYTEFDDLGLTYSLISFFSLFVLQDGFYYLTHRLLHIPYLYKHIHLVHHRSRQPTPWAAFSLHPVEKALELSFYPIVIFLMPLHPVILLSFLFYSTITNMIGHSGVELRWIPWLGKWHIPILATTLFHDLHHQHPNKNFSLYLTFWDWLLSTKDKSYEVKLKRQTSILKKSDQLHTATH